jgi:hypothetical protein
VAGGAARSDHDLWRRHLLPEAVVSPAARC